MEHAVSAFYPEVPHGAGLVSLSVGYFNYLAERYPDKRFVDMAIAMGEDISGLSTNEKPFAFIKALKRLIKSVGLEDERLSSYGVKKDDFKSLAENSFHAMGGLYDVTPVKLSLDDVIAIYAKSYR